MYFLAILSETTVDMPPNLIYILQLVKLETGSQFQKRPEWFHALMQTSGPHGYPPLRSCFEFIHR